MIYGILAYRSLRPKLDHGKFNKALRHTPRGCLTPVGSKMGARKNNKQQCEEIGQEIIREGQNCCKCICRWQKTDKNGSHFDSTELNYVVTVSMTIMWWYHDINDNDDDNTSNGGRVCGYHSIKQIIFGFASKGLSKH